MDRAYGKNGPDMELAQAFADQKPNKEDFHPKEIVETEISKAVKVLCKALDEDPDYRMTWQANIAMAFKDEHDNGEHQSLHDVANNGAKRFLANLTRNVN